MSAQQQVQIGINRIYLKDMSFESPGAPAIFGQPLDYRVDLNVQVEHQEVGAGVFEVVLRLTAEAKKADAVGFLCEVEQAGIFAIPQLPVAALQQVLRVFCPHTLFPYARQAIDAALTLGNLPPLMLGHMNFEAMLQRHDEGIPAGNA